MLLLIARPTVRAGGILQDTKPRTVLTVIDDRSSSSLAGWLALESWVVCFVSRQWLGVGCNRMNRPLSHCYSTIVTRTRKTASERNATATAQVAALKQQSKLLLLAPPSRLRVLLEQQLPERITFFSARRLLLIPYENRSIDLPTDSSLLRKLWRADIQFARGPAVLGREFR